MAQIVPIRLYRESDFLLGGMRVQPSLNRVSARGDTVRLEPKIMKVLVVLWRAKGEVVSRADLIREVWEGQAVTDDAITRCISRLRRLFTEEFPGSAEIETVQKTGYRLVRADGAGEVIPTARLRAKFPFTAASLALAVVAGALGLALWRVQGTGIGGHFADGIHPFATSPGYERYPAFSPDGQSAAFAWRAPDSGDYDIYRVDTEGEGRLRLTSDPGQDIRPTWSPDGTRMAFARLDNATNICTVLVMPAIGGAARKIAECHGRIVALDWGRTGDILLGYQDRPYTEARLFRVNPATAASAEIPLPEGFPLGVDNAVVSPDGNFIALTLSPTLGVEDIYIMASAGGEPRRLTTKNLKVHGLAWTPDGSAVLASTNWLGAFGLWRVPLDGGEPVRILNAARG
ncbi:MAG TPA: winged helix-turn-helix domain-containing protein, partial [Sphingomonadales bacterium]|nr:winged helix-turn-helix domain-containing protein [Sphingomonadales bacterium]